jgi:peptidase M28-like protein/PDZ domain-containing protein/PA domain-containing protein
MRPTFSFRHFGRTSLAGFTAALLIASALIAWALDPNLSVPSATDELLRHVKFLSSPELTGRGVDTSGIKLAQDYIGAEFAKSGLKPGGDQSTFFQSFDAAVGVNIMQPSSFNLGSDAPLQLTEQWIPLGLSTSDKVTGDLIFAGYGITAKNYGYDDYASIDVKGKIALVLRYEPPPKDDKSPFRKFPDASTYAALRTKANNARDHGAVGMILVDLNHTGDDGSELLSTNSSLWRGGNSLVAVQVKRRIIESWLDARGVSLQALKEKIDADGKPASTAIPHATASIQVNLQEKRERTANVVGILPGADPALKEQRIVIGAHYDHLGFGHFGALDRQAESQIHPGADDNASGTAVLLDLARRLSQLPTKPARTIVFIAFSGEELGLYGSRYFVEHADSLPSIKAMINLDMVGRLRENHLTVFGAGSGENLSQLVADAAHQVGLSFNESDDVGRSDHMSFYSKKIPVLHFFTGNHVDYHRATDTWEKLNIEGMAKVSDLVMLTALELANAREPIGFVSLPSRPTGDVGRGRGVRSYLGTIPDYGATATGVRLAGVSGNSPAEHAGMREGDVIIRLGARKIQNIEDLTDALGEHQSGDEVEIELLRAGKPLTLKAVLSSRG